jgi:hypothetical protein
MISIALLVLGIANADDVALKKLFDETLPGKFGGPGVVDVKLSENNFLEPRERELVERNRERVVAEMKRQLHDSGSPIASLMLAQLREQSAVSEIKRWFVDVKDMYGWARDNIRRASPTKRRCAR